MFQHYFDDISFAPFKRELKGYSVSSLGKDLFAGVSVALLTLPQAMAFALVAGLPLSTGLFAAIFSCLIGALFGSSRHLVIGPSNAIAIMIQYGTAEILYNYYRNVTGAERDAVAFQVMTQLTALVAGLHLLAAGFKLGHLTQFVSYSVVLGYVVGASTAIFVGQLFVFLGIPEMEGIHSIWEKGIYLLFHLYEVHWMTFIVGLGSLMLLVGLKRLKKGLPYALITYVIVTVSLKLFKLYVGGEALHVLVIGDTGEISGLQPQVLLPHFNFAIMNDLLPVAFAVALLSILETSAVGKAIASRTGQRLSINQEILGLGLGNLTSAFCGAMPVSGSTSRTILNFESGAQTRVAGVMGALVVGGILFLFGSLVLQVPLSALSALLLMTAASLVKKKQVLLCLKSTRSDAFVFLMTFLSCIFFGIDVAFYIGVSLSIILYLKKAAVPQVQQYFVDEAGRIKSLEFCTAAEKTPIRFIKVKGELFFGAADLFQTTLKTIAEDDTNTKVIILQLKNARDIDATACLALQQLHDYLKGSGRHFILSGLTLSVWEVISDSGLVKAIGRENLFLIHEKNPSLYFELAIKRAQELVRQEDRMKEELVLPEEKGLEQAPLTLATTNPILQDPI